jgi:hypothetical protein
MLATSAAGEGQSCWILRTSACDGCAEVGTRPTWV